MITEKTVVGAGGEYPLNGMLTLPDDLEKGQFRELSPQQISQLKTAAGMAE